MNPATKVLKEVSRVAEEQESIPARTKHNFKNDVKGSKAEW